jgi:hypothetical protein
MRYFKYVLISMLCLMLWACGDSNTSQHAAAQLPPQQAVANVDSSPQSRTVGQEDEFDRFLRKHKVESSRFAEVRKLVKEKSMIPAVREIQGSTQLPLPKAKAIVDTLFQMVHGEIEE